MIQSACVCPRRKLSIPTGEPPCRHCISADPQQCSHQWLSYVSSLVQCCDALSVFLSSRASISSAQHARVECASQAQFECIVRLFAATPTQAGFTLTAHHALMHNSNLTSLNVFQNHRHGLCTCPLTTLCPQQEHMAILLLDFVHKTSLPLHAL